ncbi:MAG: hypothetical protein V1784_04895 [bacterium]
MTPVGWMMMLLSWGVIVGLFVFCLVKIFRTQKANIRAPLEIEMED